MLSVLVRMIQETMHYSSGCQRLQFAGWLAKEESQ